MKLVFLFLCFVTVTVGQQPVETKEMCEERAAKIVQTLEPNSFLRNSIEQGGKGDCVHQSWMDTMQKFGVKRAAFLVEYSWKNNKVNFKVKNLSYYRSYHLPSDAGEIEDRKTLREIKEGGLEQKLKEVVIAQAKTSAFATYEKGQVKRDSFTANLYDDEALPVFWIIT